MIIEGLSGATPTGTGQANEDGKKLDDDLNRFLNLLVTQLQNQDPLDPLDANEFTAQLVQFASVEQQIYQNANLEKLLAAQQNMQVASMVNYLGTTAEASGNALSLENGNAEASYSLSDNAAATTIAIKDGLGRIVYVAPGETGAGRHSFSWDGRDNLGNALPDGAYVLEVSAKRPDDSLVDIDQTTFGRVTGAASEDGQVLLYLGDTAVPIENVLSVKEAEPPQASD